MTADQIRNRLLQTLWSMGELEPLIRSGSEFDPARRAILKLQWRAQRLEFHPGIIPIPIAPAGSAKTGVCIIARADDGAGWDSTQGRLWKLGSAMNISRPPLASHLSCNHLSPDRWSVIVRHAPRMAHLCRIGSRRCDWRGMVGANSRIEWTDHTFNAVVGCTKVSAACDHCYAEGWAKRTGHPELWNGERRRTSASNWKLPLKWNREATARGQRARVFCCSLADVFDNQWEPQWRADLFRLIYATPNLDWLLLTKRPQNIRKLIQQSLEIPSDGSTQQGAIISRGNTRGGIGDRQHRQDLARNEAHRESLDGRVQDDALRADASGHHPVARRLSQGRHHGEGPNGTGDGPSLGLRGPDRADSGGVNHQPQGWRENQQRAIEHGTGDPLGAAETCAPNIRRESEGSSWRGAQALHDNTGQSAGNAAAAAVRSGDKGLGSRVRNDAERGLLHLHEEVLETPTVALWLQDWLRGSPPFNVWIGCTAENQEEADRRIPHLLAVPAAVHFLSCEPLLGPIDLEHLPSVSGIGRYLNALWTPTDEYADIKSGINWVIAGGESGPHARPMHQAWAISLKRQCSAAGVAFFMKQMSGRIPEKEIDRKSVV